jgi:hypothetical protein
MEVKQRRIAYSLCDRIGRICARCGLAMLLVASKCGTAHAQNELGDIRFAAFAGPAYSSSSTKIPFQCGMSIDQTIYPTKLKNFAAGYLLEGGYLRPALVNAGTAYLSVDGMLGRHEPATGGKRTLRTMPFAVLGYTRLVNTSHAINFGAGVDRAISEDRFWLRGEIRDELALPSGRHGLGFRIGLVFKGTLR